ncbi:MAG: NAD(P)-dependent oxidoreductase [Candidatus Falkowbacteria bacterium]
MKKILIIGHKGMLGQELIKIFPNATGLDVENINIIDKEQVENKIKILNPEIIINCAAYNAVYKCETPEEFKIAKKINGEAVGYLADTCVKLNATLVHYSTNYVFGKHTNGTNIERKTQIGYDENDQPSPINKYGQTKLLGEQKILSAPSHKADKQGGLALGWKYYLIRTSKLFGQQGSSEMAKENFFNLMMRLAETQNELKVVDDELSNFTYTPDLAQATKNLLKQNYPAGIYHIVNENPATWAEGAKALFDILKKDVKLIPVDSDEFPRPAKRPRFAVLNNNKLPKLRGYEEALAEYLQKIPNPKHQIPKTCLPAGRNSKS